MFIFVFCCLRYYIFMKVVSVIGQKKSKIAPIDFVRFHRFVRFLIFLRIVLATGMCIVRLVGKTLSEPS